MNANPNPDDPVERIPLTKSESIIIIIPTEKIYLKSKSELTDQVKISQNAKKLGTNLNP